MVGAFEHPAAATTRLILKVLQKPLVKAVSLEMPGFVEPMSIARNTIGRIEAQAGENMGGDLGALLGRTGIYRVHSAELRSQEAEQPQLSAYPPDNQVRT